jgi:hypothetical protein
MRRRARRDVGAATGCISSRKISADEVRAAEAPRVNQPGAANSGYEGGEIEMAAKKKAKKAKKAKKK